MEHLLKEKLAEPRMGSGGETALHRLAQCTFSEDRGAAAAAMAEILLQSGATVDALNFRELTPLLVAVCKGNIGIAEILLKNGADVNVTGVCIPMLHFASIGMDPADGAMHELLIQHGADINSRDFRGCCHPREAPLHEAASRGCLGGIRVLVRYGADLNARDLCQSTPLHKAVRNGSNGFVDALIPYGAEVNVCEKRMCQTPLQSAALRIGSGWDSEGCHSVESLMSVPPRFIV